MATFFGCYDHLAICHLVYYFLTKELKNMGNQRKKFRKLRKKCHYATGYRHSNKIEKFREAFYRMRWVKL